MVITGKPGSVGSPPQHTKHLTQLPARVGGWAHKTLTKDQTWSTATLACDVLLRKCDHSFSNGAAGYSQESASIAWDQMFERQEGMDVMEVARALTRAYVQKQGDQAGIDVRTVWNHTHMAHEINDRMIIVLTRDQASKERGADNAMKFKELIACRRASPCQESRGDAP
eukprot:scaffold13313_cov126-Isochrysis_galbana.AAC.1